MSYATASEIRRLRLTNPRQVAKLAAKACVSLPPAMCRRIAEAASELEREARAATDANPEVAGVFDALDRCQRTLDGMTRA